MFRQILLVTALVFGVSAFAGPQQEKMKSCNEQSAGKKGDERKSFMKTCLSAPAPAAQAAQAQLPPVPPPPAAKLTPQERMKKCNEEAKGKKGDERKAFMSTCLKAP